MHLALFLLWAAPGEEGAAEGDGCLRGQGGLDGTVQMWRCPEGEFLTKHAVSSSLAHF